MKKSSIVWLSLLILLSIISFIHVKPAHAQTTTVFVDPPAIIDQTKQSGSKFTVYINISDVIDLYLWQVNIMWEPSMLEIPSAANITYGNVFEGLNPFPFLEMNNTEGWVFISESLVGGSGVDVDSGWLCSIGFLVENYGSTELEFRTTPPRPTYFLDSEFPPNLIPFTPVDGYFSNKLPGDADSDRDVDYDDLVILADAYGSSNGQPAYDARADFDNDDDVDLDDFFILAVNHGKSV